MWHSTASYFDVTTIGGLATFSYNGHNADFLGCLLAEPDTAKRDGNVKVIDKTDWAKEQYHILQKQGLSDEDKLYLPYILGKYGVDMSDEMIIRICNKTGETRKVNLTDFLFELKELNKKLVLPLSNFLDGKRIENYLDYERTLKLISENELLFIVEENSNFLNTQKNDVEFPYNIINCINVIAEKQSLMINSQIEDHKAISSLSGSCKGLIISIL